MSKAKFFRGTMGLAILAGIWALSSTGTGCKVYSFRDFSIPDSIQVIKVNYIDNKASYVNPQPDAATDRPDTPKDCKPDPAQADQWF